MSDFIRFLRGDVSYLNKNLKGSEEQLRAILTSFDVFNFKDIQSIPDVRWHEKSLLGKFCAILLESQFLFSLTLNKKVSYSPYFQESVSTLLGSFFYKGVNYLVFKSGNEVFFIGQYLHTVDFVFLPKYQIIVKPNVARFHIQHVENLIRFVYDKKDELSSFFLKKNTSKLNLLINGISPYHFFYDSISNLIPFKKSEFHGVEKVYVLNKKLYFPLECFLGDQVEIIDDVKSFDNKILTSNKTNCLIGQSYKILTESELKFIDDSVCNEASLIPHTHRVSEVIQRLSPHSFIVWIGVSSQKRAWLNQKETLIELCEILYKKYPGVVIIFDGMTSNLFNEKSAQKDFENDHLMVKEIRSNLNKDIPIKSIVGFNSIEKLQVAKMVDFFVTNYSTGSIYVSRFYKKHGVAHLSNKLLEAVRNIHEHSNCYVVPADFVNDIPDLVNPRIDFVSYEIEKNKFLNFTLSRVSEFKSLGVSSHLKKMQFESVVVTPMYELIQANQGLSTHRGGPILPNWDSQIRARHLRGLNPVDDIPKLDEEPLQQIQAGVWCGPVSNHFGHQISEFSMRLPQSLIDNPDACLIFSVMKDSGIISLDNCPAFFRDILDWFGVKPSQVLIVSKPILVRTLVVFPQAETLRGNEPLKDHLLMLNYFTSKNFFHPEFSLGQNFYDITYVARANAKSGRWLGEGYLVSFLKNSRVNVFYPEKVSLKEQLAVYQNSRHLIFAEGSAIHALQLLGDSLKKVTVFFRRSDTALFIKFARPRCKIYEELDFCKEIFFSKNIFGTPLDASGMTLVNKDNLKDYFTKLGLDTSKWSNYLFHDAVIKDLKNWISNLAFTSAQHPDAKENILTLLNKNNFTEVFKLAKAIIPNTPSDQGALDLYKSSIHEKLLPKALELLDLAYSSSGDQFFLKEKAVLLLKNNYPKESLKVFNALDLLTTSDVDKYNKALALYRCENFAGSLILVNDFLAKYSFLECVYVLKSNILGALGLYEEQLDNSIKGVGDVSNSHTLCFLTSIGYSRFNKNDKALNYVDNAIAIKPESSYYRHKSVLLDRLSSLNEAYDSIGLAMNLNPNDVNNINQKALLSIKLNKFLTARELLLDSVHRFGVTEFTFKNILKVSLSVADYDLALEYIDKFGNNFKDVESLLQTAKIYFALNRPTLAKKFADEAIKLNSNYAPLINFIKVLHN
ncbi:DUF563 domain-containing protein [Candidatus Falkowbacteria bacterium]|nr:DUF563 domain-containing protein [Candidatus Falkowbacteria bacterium]